MSNRITQLAERKIYLVRHGQASLGAADYDNLSERGHAQAARLGDYFAARGIAFDAAYAGTLRRHAQTYQGIALAQPLPNMALRAGLNEYDSEAVIGAILSSEQLATLKSPTSGAGYKQHFTMLRKGIGAWMRGEVQPAGMTTYAEFAAGVMAVLDDIRHSDAQSVLISSSGGPLSSAVAQVLGLSHEAGIELNMRMRNTAVSELLVTPKRCVLLTFNTLPHLDDEVGRAMQTYA
ncbi:MAG: histidine phosphatase family protein [Cytophagales bacterium]|nr:histidine phosphatase family protein [Cytophagales bacterium]